MAQMAKKKKEKNPPIMQKTQVQSLGQEDPSTGEGNGCPL